MLGASAAVVVCVVFVSGTNAVGAVRLLVAVSVVIIMLTTVVVAILGFLPLAKRAAPDIDGAPYDNWFTRRFGAPLSKLLGTVRALKAREKDQ